MPPVTVNRNGQSNEFRSHASRVTGKVISVYLARRSNFRADPAIARLRPGDRAGWCRAAIDLIPANSPASPRRWRKGKNIRGGGSLRPWAGWSAKGWMRSPTTRTHFFSGVGMRAHRAGAEPVGKAHRRAGRGHPRRIDHENLRPTCRWRAVWTARPGPTVIQTREGSKGPAANPWLLGRRREASATSWWQASRTMTTLPPIPAGFASTRWTLVERDARGFARRRRAALSELCAAYYAPVVAFSSS